MQDRFALCEGSVVDVCRSFYLASKQDDFAEAASEANRVDCSGIAYATAANDNLRVNDRLRARCEALLRRLLAPLSNSPNKAAAAGHE
jgi:hypothetical protein